MAVHGFAQLDNNLTQEKNYYSNPFIRNETYNKKISLAKSRIFYCTNTILALCLTLSQDIPRKKQKSPTCSKCNETIRSNSKKSYSTVCGSITHLK